MNFKAAYFIGIGGAGMSAIARFFSKKGHVVKGYDKVSTRLTDFLKIEGIDINFEDDIEQAPKLALESRKEKALFFKSNELKGLKKHSEYFTTPSLQYKIMQPFILTNTEGNFDLKITVKGGGSNGQADAVRLAISRALCKVNIEHRAELKSEGLLTRDPRMVERKKFGQKKARKKFQFSKR